jgi:hypothetical protein
MVHASGGDLVEVTLVDEGAPVLVQDSPALIGTIDGTQGPLVNGSIASGIKD